MSLIDLASMVLAPTAVKDGKVYNAIPNDQDFTFSRGTEATRVNSAGLIEKARTNYLYYSQDFSNSNWVLQNNATITHNITDPNGGTTASRLTFDALTNSGLYQQQLTNFGTGLIRTASIYLKGAVGGENVMIGDASNRTRVVLTTDWVRYEGFASDDSTFFIIYTDHISGASSDTIDIAFAQYENGLVATDVITTTTTSVTVGITDDLPRVDYIGGGCPSLLLEPSRTQLLTQSEYYSGSTWIKQSGTTVTQNTTDTLSPEGKYNASKVTSNGSNGLFHTVAYSGGGANTKSIYLKGVSGGEVVYLKDPYQTVSTKSCTLTTEWQRFTLSETQTSSTSLWIDDIPSGGIYMWGAMLELGSYVSSYLPSYGTSTSRSADFAVLSNASNLIGQTEGTMFVEFTRENNSVGTFSISANNVGTRIYIGTNASGLICQVRNGYAQQAYFSTAQTEDTTYKCAIAYANNDFVLYMNGTQIGTDTSGTVPACNTIRTDDAGGANLNQPLKQAILFPTRLTNDQLAELTK